jgi:hypothetical protein
MRRSVALMSQLNHKELPARNPKAWNPLLSLSVSPKYFPSQELVEQFTLAAQIHPGCNTICDSLFCVSIQYLLWVNLVPPCHCLLPCLCLSMCLPRSVSIVGVLPPFTQVFLESQLHTAWPGSCAWGLSLFVPVSVSVSAWKCCLCQPGSVAFVSLEVLPLYNTAWSD